MGAMTTEAALESVPIAVKRLGRVDYEQAWRAMKAFSIERSAATDDEIWLVEHPPVYTLGVGARPAHLPRVANGIPVVRSDRGGQIRANVVKRWDSGELKLSGTYLNDHNVFYLPIPIADPRDPDVSLDPYIDYFTGTLNTPVLRNNRMIYSDGAGGRTSEDRDLAEAARIDVQTPKE